MKDVNCVAASWFRLADLYFTFSRNIICSLTEFWTKVRMGKLFLFVPSRVIRINLCPPFRSRLFVQCTWPYLCSYITWFSLHKDRGLLVAKVTKRMKAVSNKNHHIVGCGLPKWDIKSVKPSVVDCLKILLQITLFSAHYQLFSANCQLCNGFDEELRTL